MTELVQIGRASSAQTTDFVSHRLDGPGGKHLFVDGNQKVSGWVPKPNAFSLLAGNGADELTPGHERHHCPGSTPTCRASCYVHGLAKHAGSTYDLYRHNSVAIREILEDALLRVNWSRRLGEWIAENCADVGFRWHVSGDIFSLAYARWVADVCRAAPAVNFWIYTRSFEYLDPLVDVATFTGGNLALNLSCDRDNYQAAKDACNRWGFWEGDDGNGFATGFAAPRLCYLTTDGEVPEDLDPHRDVVFPDYLLRAPKGSGPVEQRETNPWYQSLPSEQRRMICAVDYYGKNEAIRCGVCTRCLK